MKWIRASQFNVGSWSGGTTTELIIYPENSSYSELNFDFRLSTATVEVEESDFTPLPGVSRSLMVLSGEMELVHEGHHTSELGPFDLDIFDGGWKTKSYGTCTDFNLMCRGNTSGKVMHFPLTKNALERFGFHGDQNFIYVVSGSFECGEDHFEAGDLVIPESPQLTVHALQDCELVVVEIHL